MSDSANLSVIVPTLNAAPRVAAAFSALVQPAVSGLIKEVIVVDGGSSDDTVKIAEEFGARVMSSPPARGGQLQAGANAASGDWFLFLHGDTVLQEGWDLEVRSFMERRVHSAGVFTLAFDTEGLAPSLVAFGANIRTRWNKLPYGDQGFFISRKFFDAIGGYADIPLFEDVDIVQRLVSAHGRQALFVFQSKAITSAARYENDGYGRRVLKNMTLLTRYLLGASPEELAKDY